ncbi:type II toxin-antitoxin system HicB family antitoxin [Candidatus Micrarchaeota archaeon]|nr:type II toxin-antitoxin system HicB family antitoxin [Candidatus Micrarchaeota archaeon]
METTVIIKKEGDWYVARAVEVDIVSQGKTIEEAMHNIREAVELYLEDEDAAAGSGELVIYPMRVGKDAKASPSPC